MNRYATIPFVFALAAPATFMSVAAADFVGLATEKVTTAAAAENDLWTVDVFAVFDHPDDRLIAVTHGQADTNRDEFFDFSHFNITGDLAPLIGGNHALISSDTFMTIGVEWDDGTDETDHCPVIAIGNTVDGGWCVPEDSFQGEAVNYQDGLVYRVRIMRLTTEQGGIANSAAVWGSADIAYLKNGSQNGIAETDFYRAQYVVANGVWSNWHGNGGGGDGLVPHQPLGGAVVTPGTPSDCADCLIVSNIGSSGDDGVRIGGFDVEAFSMEWLPLRPPTAPRSLSFEANGGQAAGDDEPLGNFTMQSLTSDLNTSELSADFAAIGSEKATLRIFTASGLLRAEYLGVPTSGILTRFTGAPIGVEFDGTGPVGNFQFHFADTTVFEIASETAAGSLLVVEPENTNAPLETLTSLGIRLANVAELTIVDELGFAQPVCTGDVNDDGAVGFADVLAVLAAFETLCEGCDEDINSDGQVNFQDLLGVLSAWGPCL